MDNFVWRFRSRLVAIFDVVFSCVLLALLVLSIFLALFATATVVDQTKADPDPDLRETAQAAIIALWVIMGLLIIVIFVDLSASIMLLKATREGADTAQALHRAKIWRNVVIVFLIFNFLFGLMSGHYFPLLFSFIFRGIMLYIVYKYIQELKGVAISYQIPVSVVVKH